VQRARTCRRSSFARLFQSSPVPKDGCNIPVCAHCLRDEVSILTRPEGRVQRVVHNALQSDVLFQSSPVPKDGCNKDEDIELHATRRVSILTRPEGRVQPPFVFGVTRSSGGFQSSPVPKDGCNEHPVAHQRIASAFQSSPVPKDGCNPQRSRATGRAVWFQSSPVPKDGCNRPCQKRLAPLLGVSILTRPEGRVQLACVRHLLDAHQFQSSPVPKDGCNAPHGGQGDRAFASFNPHPSRRTGATALEKSLAHALARFNPHPSRRTGATGADR